MGADVIKVATSGGVLSPRDQPTSTRTSVRPSSTCSSRRRSAAGIFVMAHAQATDGIKNAVRAGIRSIEHGIFLDDQAIDLMLEAGHVARPDARRAPGRDRRGRGRRARARAEMVDKARAVVETHRASFRRAVEAGVRDARSGTDSGDHPRTAGTCASSR